MVRQVWKHPKPTLGSQPNIICFIAECAASLARTAFGGFLTKGHDLSACQPRGRASILLQCRRARRILRNGFVANISSFGEPAPKIRDAGILSRRDADGELGGSGVVWAIERNGRDRKATLASFGSFVQPLACPLEHGARCRLSGLLCQSWRTAPTGLRTKTVLTRSRQSRMKWAAGAGSRKRAIAGTGNRNRKFADSLLEGSGFELPVRRRSHESAVCAGIHPPCSVAHWSVNATGR